MIYTIKLLDLT